MNQDKILERKIREISEQVYAEKTLKSQYGVAQVPFHVHSGTDSSRINEKDLVNNIKNHFVISNIVGDGNQHILVFNNIPNVKELVLSGAAGDGTNYVIMNGRAVFGKIYPFNYVSGDTFDLVSGTNGESVASTCNAMNVIPGSAAEVSVTPGFIAASPGGEIQMQIILVTQQFITVGYTFTAGWAFGATVQLL